MAKVKRPWSVRSIFWSEGDVFGENHWIIILPTKSLILDAFWQHNWYFWLLCKLKLNHMEKPLARRCLAESGTESLSLEIPTFWWARSQRIFGICTTWACVTPSGVWSVWRYIQNKIASFKLLVSGNNALMITKKLQQYFGVDINLIPFAAEKFNCDEKSMTSLDACRISFDKTCRLSSKQRL